MIFDFFRKQNDFWKRPKIENEKRRKLEKQKKGRHLEKHQ